MASRLLVVQADGRSVGLVVDGAREFASFDPSLIQPPSTSLTGLSGRYLEGIANVAGRLILVLDLVQVLKFDDPVAEGRP